MSKLTKRCRAKFDRLNAINSMPASERPAQARRMIIAQETDGRSKRVRNGENVKLGSMWNPNNKRFAR